MKTINLRRVLSLTALSVLTLSATAQQITTKHPIVDLGRVTYRQPVTADFQLRNSSRSEITINEVRTNCGCTVAKFPRQTIGRGKEFIVSATYDAKQLGHFEKLVGGFVDGQKEPFVVKLRGVVVSDMSDFDGSYKHLLGQLQVDKDNIEFDNVNRGDRPVQEIHILNNSKKTLEPVLMHLPSYLSATVSPKKIAPGRSGIATITLDSYGVHNLGLTQTNIYLGEFPGDKVSESNVIPVTTVLLPARQNLTESELGRAPHLQLTPRSFDLGEFGSKKKKKGEIIIHNAGQSTLRINSLQMFTPGIEVKLDDTRIEPGKTAKMKLTAYKNQLKKARTQPRILMITNDPDNSKVVININVK